MTCQLRYLIIGVTLIIGSCAPNKGLETQLIEAGQMTDTACRGGGVWEVVAVNKYVFRCNTDIPSQWTKATSPPPTQEPPAPAITSPRNSGADCNYNSKGDWDCVIARSCFPGSDGLYYEHVKLQSDNSWHPTGAYC